MALFLGARASCLPLLQFPLRVGPPNQSHRRLVLGRGYRSKGATPGARKMRALPGSIRFEARPSIKQPESLGMTCQPQRFSEPIARNSFDGLPSSALPILSQMALKSQPHIREASTLKKPSASSAWDSFSKIVASRKQLHAGSPFSTKPPFASSPAIRKRLSSLDLRRPHPSGIWNCRKGPSEPRPPPRLRQF